MSERGWRFTRSSMDSNRPIVDLRRECPNELAVLAPNTHATAIQDPDENHDPASVVVVEEILTGPNVRARLEGVGGENMPQLVRCFMRSHRGQLVVRQDAPGEGDAGSIENLVHAHQQRLR